jgi:hypothetical protein
MTVLLNIHAAWVWPQHRSYERYFLQLLKRGETSEAINYRCIIWDFHAVEMLIECGLWNIRLRLQYRSSKNFVNHLQDYTALQSGRLWSGYINYTATCMQLLHSKNSSSQQVGRPYFLLSASKYRAHVNNSKIKYLLQGNIAVSITKNSWLKLFRKTIAIYSTVLIIWPSVIRYSVLSHVPRFSNSRFSM